MMRIFALLCAAMLAAAADGWTGTVVVEESFEGPPLRDGGQARELERLAAELTRRRERARVEAESAPATISRVLREDIGVFDAELERLVIERGGSVPLGRSVIRIASGRIAIVAGGTRMVVQRAGGSALVLGDGVRRELTVRPPESAEPADPSPGPEVLGRTTRLVRLRSEGREYEVLLAGALPNPYALTLPADGSATDLQNRLATLPGMPLQVDQRAGSAVRRIRVVSLEPGLPDLTDTERW